MTHEFDRVRTAFASSGLARALAIAKRVTGSGWRSSAFREALRPVAGHVMRTSTPELIRTAAVAIAAAAVVQPPLMWMMTLTVRPAIPAYVFVAIALIAAVAAWRPGDVATALAASRFARWLRR